MTRLAIVVLFAGLIGPAMAAAPDAQAPAQKKAGAAKPSSPDKVIAEILAVSGMKKALEKMPENFVTGFNSGLEKAKNNPSRPLPADLVLAMENSAKNSFTASGFSGRVTRAMKKDYNEKNYEELLTDLSTPLALHMAELESKGTPSSDEFSDFSAKLLNNPLSAQRRDLLHRLDVASRTTDLMTTIMLSINKGMMNGMAHTRGNCVSEAQLKQTEDAMEAKIGASRANFEVTVVNMLAYTYRDVSDEDLTQYLAIYEKDNSKHIHDVIYTAIVEEFSQASTNMGHGIMKAVKHKKAAMGDQACEDNSGSEVVAQTQAAGTPPQTEPEAPATAPEAASAPAAAEQQGTPVSPKSAIPLEKRQGGDITQCLEAGSKSDKDIAACAEKYRKAK